MNTWSKIIAGTAGLGLVASLLLSPVVFAEDQGADKGQFTQGQNQNYGPCHGGLATLSDLDSGSTIILRLHCTLFTKNIPVPAP